MISREDAIQNRTYLVSTSEIKELVDKARIVEIEDKIKTFITSLTAKEISMYSRGMVVANAEGKIIYTEDSSHLQHFFPLLMRDFAKLAYEHARFDKPLPIMSIDSHDVIGCDFRCLDCLSGNGRSVVRSEVNLGFELPPEKYLHILSEISEYSRRRGINSVRFEQSGEGNPDFYKHRPEIIKEAKLRYNMNTVYITTGSKMSNELMHALINYSSFIRISFPGLDNRTYALYSKNEKYTFYDSIARLKELVEMRRSAGRERELMIGVRAALRPEQDPLYFDFGKLIKSIGIDCMQVVKILAPEGLAYTKYEVSQTCKQQLAMLSKLSSNEFNVALPNELDYMYYERVIWDKARFPKRCYSSIVQPVLTGSGLFVCTKSDIMYSSRYRFGNFTGEKGELERFLSPENVERITNDVPSSCTTCGNIFDNLLFNNITKLANNTDGPLKFYQVVSY